MSPGGTDYVMKAVVVGPSMAGKTSMCNALDQRAGPTATTIGVGFSSVRIRAPEGGIRLQIWDVGGHPTFREATSSYLRGAVLVVCVLDLSSELATAEAREWLRLAKQENEGLPTPEMLLLGNKTDLPRAAGHGDLSALGSEFGARYAEGSAMYAPNGVLSAFEELALRALKRKDEYLACPTSSLFARSDPYGDLDAPRWGGRKLRARGCACPCYCPLL